MEERYNIEEQRYYEVLPIKNTVLFPGVLLPIAVSKKNSLKLIKSADKEDRPIILLTQKDDNQSNPEGKDLYTLGTLAHVIQIIPVPQMGKDTMMTVFEGLKRIQVNDFKVDENGQLLAQVVEIAEQMPLKSDKQFKVTVDAIKETVLKILDTREEVPTGLQATIKTLSNAPTLLNYICAIYPMPSKTKQGLLEIHSLSERATALLELLEKDLAEENIKADVRRRTAEKIDQRQREYFLQQEMETIKKDLGDDDNNEQTIKELRARAKEKKWNESVAEQFEKEVKRLEHMHMFSPDYSTQLDYLNTMLELPWGVYSDDNFDMNHAQEILNRDHYGLDKVKQRIVEYLAVQRMLALRSAKDKEDHPVKSPILCL